MTQQQQPAPPKPKPTPQPESDHYWEKAKLGELREDGESRVAFILRYTISLPQAHTVIVGTQSLDHLRENVDAVLKGPLQDETYAEAKRRLDEAGESPAAVK